MEKAVHHIKDKIGPLRPTHAIVLGSGLSSVSDTVQNPIEISFDELEGFPKSHVSGHQGKLIIGRLGQYDVVVLSGRVHYYEQGDAGAMRPIIETFSKLGIQNLFLSNAAGSVQEDMPPGSVMLITDHINFSGSNPLFGEPTDKRFVGLTNAYDHNMMEKLRDSAARQDIALYQGVYMWFSGPSFETPAEIKMARIIGADAVGMSTVPEVILARFYNINVAACSVITNFAAGMTSNELSHEETKEMAPMGGQKLARILEGFFAA